ncbi:hypothetical protein BS47DRAFT_1433530 [Hydnum rufescens UP504]|uniref:5-formyltetrahydrofolate cyclo-ligase n=1 Tax=Hydnum rufescens UP504 TaxID=1448309 RepID=A0A9P6DZS8_9AGAM|nr:hypothetical protein BS47DRAFT_1433530 [Hydnum rufescens UP504]
MASIQTLRSQKKALRSSILAARKLIPSASVNSQSEHITRSVLQCPEFKESESISCYLSMPGEVDTSAIVDEILRQGKKLFVPRTDSPSNSIEMLRIYDGDDLRSLPSGLWGIREPGPSPLDSGLSLILMPGVAFDRSFCRIGYGKGYYDRFLSSYSSKHGHVSSLLSYLWFLLAVGLALAENVLDFNTIPTGSNDWSVHGIASPAFLADGDTRGESKENDISGNAQDLTAYCIARRPS